MEHLPQNADQLIRQALDEDIDGSDITTLSTVAEQSILNGRLIVKAEGVTAGLNIFKRTLELLNKNVRFSALVEDGQAVGRGTVLAKVNGPGRALLSGERTALNFLQRMSGIASLTRQYVDAVTGTKAVILDTRKTAPGLRLFDKMAVRLGGGQNHRFGLFDMILIKENHIAAAGGLEEAVTKARAFDLGRHAIEVEVKTLHELQRALSLQVDRIMLDNMSLADKRRAVELADGKIPLEASGNVTLQTIRAIAETGVDFISVGALTHSVKALDISFLIE
jgi:nicotinate-nucleotide pyrophosphorylase (carboxylating)